MANHENANMTTGRLKSGQTPGQLRDFSQQKALLEAEKGEILRRLEATDEYGLRDGLRDQLAELSMYDNHPADIGDELFERGKDLALKDADLRLVSEIDHALMAISDGSYGTCVECGQAIPEERLLAYPTSAMCIHCKRQDETNHPARQRPVEEEFLWPGFGRSSRDDAAVGALDGEDIWQSVARFNEREDGENAYEGIESESMEGIVDDTDELRTREFPT